MVMLKTPKKAAPKAPDVDVDITPIRAPAAYTPKRMGKKSAALLALVGAAPAIGFTWAFITGQDIELLTSLIGPYLLLAWPVFLALGAKFWVQKITAERNKTAAEWRQPLIAARSRIAALEVVARARYKRPEGWPDEWPRDSIS